MAQPAQLEEPRGERRAHRAREVVPLFAPVHAVADRAPAGGQPVQVDAEPGQRVPAGAGEAVVDVVPVSGRAVAHRLLGAVAAVVSGEQAAVEQGFEEAHAEPAGEVVVARTGAAQGPGGAALAQRGDREGRRDDRQRLQGDADVGSGQTVVAAPAGALRQDQSRFDELAQMDARRRGAHPASAASRPAASARPSPSAFSIRAREGSAISCAARAMSGWWCTWSRRPPVVVLAMRPA
ncbi:hypothetical protein O1L60_04690 [Streptomyces diastatochromogenes]|nr:hypothetical protein [Streptomyces diastatochromogenes]